ncbi:MAG: tetratricopeptide repeat protein, partial [Myxococcaceae bacterium]
MGAKINKRKATALLEQAKLHLSVGQQAKAEEILNEVAYRSELEAAVLFAVLADAQDAPERLPDVIATLAEGLRRFPGDTDLEVRMGHALLRQDQIDEGLKHFERAKAKLHRDPNFLTQYAFALTRAGRLDEAEACLDNALAGGGGLEARLVMAIARGQRGHYAQADELAQAVEKAAKKPGLIAAARSVRADCRLFLGDAPGALALWKELRETRQLED